jgi:hypothetical protein
VIALKLKLQDRDRRLPSIINYPTGFSLKDIVSWGNSGMICLDEPSQTGNLRSFLKNRAIDSDTIGCRTPSGANYTRDREMGPVFKHQLGIAAPLMNDLEAHSE